MQKFQLNLLLPLLISCAISIFTINTAQAQNVASPDTCTLSEKEFAKLFHGGKPARNGLVNFANSLEFPNPNNTKCDFYKWAQQMFLWVASPVAGSGYGSSGGIVLDSPLFFDVNLNTNTAFVNGPAANTFALRSSKPEKIFAGGQAGGSDTLLSLNGSLVYFGVEINDVYAWFNTAVNSSVLPAGTPFPSTKAELAKIVAYAAKNKTKLPDANALTMELKTAWIDAATLPNPQDYITIQSTVPNYQPIKDNSVWAIGKPTRVAKTLALVGIHVVGSVHGHPELVWATFEHKNNAPNDDFYSTEKGKAQLNPYNSVGSWSFMQNGGSREGSLIAQMKVCGQDGTGSCQGISSGNIVATNTINQVIPNNVYRSNPWGSLPGAHDSATVNNNDQLIWLNRDANTKLDKLHDVRANYFEVGAVWTRNGTVPASADDTTNQVGSLQLANSTMETYHQGSYSSNGKFTSGQNGCFGCHNLGLSSGNSSSTPSNFVSHIFPITNTGLATSSSSSSSSR